jgi:nucleoside-diphosphate-sugar epimerase
MDNQDALISESAHLETERFNKIYLGQKRKVLLVGGAGYIGISIAQSLADNNIDVLIMDNFIYGHMKSIYTVLLSDRIQYVQHDIRSNLDKNFFSDYQVTDIVILAGLVGDPITKKYPNLSAEINNRGVQNFINQANGNNINKLIFISTCSNYGLIKDGEKADENFPLNPLSLYAEDKVNNEQYLTSHRDEFDFSPTILRFATAFGASPRMRFDLTVNEFIYDAFTKKHLEVYDPDTWRPYCHVRDFSKLIMRVLSMEIQKTNFETFNAGGNNNNLTKRHIVEIIAKYIPDLKVDYVVGGSDPRNYVVDFSKVKNKLHFEPTWSVDDGVKELIYFLENGLYLDFPEDRNFYGNYYIEDGA